MSFEKPYPPDTITYTHYDTLVDALETRFGASAQAYIRDTTRIINTRGNIWTAEAGNIQQAIEDLYSDEGGAVILPKKMITETQPWTLDEEYPIYIRGSGMCWHEQDRGTMIKFNLANDIHCIDIDASEVIHFGGISDLTLMGGTGNRDMIHLDGVTDWHLDRVYINQSPRHGLHVESTNDSWNLWVKDCLIENCDRAIRLEGGAGTGTILKSYILNNYFYANTIDIEAGALDDTTGTVKLLQLHNNQHFNTTGIGLKLYRKATAITCMGHIFYKTTGDAVDISDDGSANKCTRINILGFLIDGDTTTPNGIDLGGYTDHVVIDAGQIYNITGTAVNQGGNTTNIKKGDIYES